MSDLIPGMPLHALDMAMLNWVQLVLATPVVLWCGWPFFERAWASVVHRSPNMFTLIALGVGAAYLFSLVATVAPNIFPEGFRLPGGAQSVGSMSSNTWNESCWTFTYLNNTVPPAGTFTGVVRYTLTSP